MEVKEEELVEEVEMKKIAKEDLELKIAGLKEDLDLEIAGIFCSNSFMMEENKSGIFPQISRFNHSCRFLAVFYFFYVFFLFFLCFLFSFLVGYNMSCVNTEFV